MESHEKQIVCRIWIKMEKHASNELLISMAI